VPLDQLATRLVETVGGLAALGLYGPFAVADGRIVHNAGARRRRSLVTRWRLGSAIFALSNKAFPSLTPDGLIFFRLAADAISS